MSSGRNSPARPRCIACMYSATDQSAAIPRNAVCQVCRWPLISPGSTTMRDASITSAPSAAIFGATATMRSRSTSTSPFARLPIDGSIETIGPSLIRIRSMRVPRPRSCPYAKRLWPAKKVAGRLLGDLGRICDRGRELLGGDPCSLARRLDPRRAILEFRNLSERIERRIREQVGGRFHERKRDEHDAVWHPIVLARGELDSAAPRGNADQVARRNAKLLELVARQ